MFIVDRVRYLAGTVVVVLATIAGRILLDYDALDEWADEDS